MVDHDIPLKKIRVLLSIAAIHFPATPAFAEKITLKAEPSRCYPRPALALPRSLGCSTLSDDSDADDPRTAPFFTTSGQLAGKPDATQGFYPFAAAQVELLL